jgi:ribosome maturation factor RimP
MGWPSPFFFSVGCLGASWAVVGPVQAVIERTVSGLGYELVDVELAGRGLVRVFIDLPPAAYAADPSREASALPPSVRMEDCEKVSHQLSHVLTVENIDYARLEVSSPGMDRPLKRAADYERFEGAEIAVRLREPLAGRRNFEGVLVRDDSPAAGPADAGSARWALELPDPNATPARKPGAKASKRGAKTKPAKGTPAQGEPGAETVRRLSFTLDEVERARLVPRIKF